MAAAKKLVSAAPPHPAVKFVDAGHTERAFVQFGLYDGAFDASASLLNSDSMEADNFVGSDSRRFFVRITDPSKVTAKATKRREIKAAWRTYFADKKTMHDSGGSDPTIVLVETAPGSGTFESSWLLLASDPWELANVKTTTGRAGLGLKSHGNGDYRLRLASMFGYVGVEYPVSTKKGAPQALAPLFNRNPSELRNLPLQVFVLQNMYVPGFENYALTKDLENIRIVYSRIGLWAWTAVDAAQRSMPGVISRTVGKEELLVIPVPPGVTNPAQPTVADCEIIAALYPGLMASGASGSPPATPGAHCNTDTIRIFYVPSLMSANGFTCPDRDFWKEAKRGASFIADAGAKVVSGTGSSAAHEIGHTLTNHPSGHYVAPTPVRRYHAPSNLMADGVIAHMGGVASSQRLWDVTDGAGVNQWTTIRGSHYTRA